MNESKQGAVSMSYDTSSAQDRRNQLQLAGMCLIWALSFVGAMLLLKRDLLPAGPLAWLVAAVPSVIAVFVVIAFVRFLREADELQRLIQLQALGIGFGGGFFILCGYMLLEQLGAPAAEGGDIMSVMPILYALSVIIGWRRYR